MTETIKNYSLIGYIKKEIEQDWVKIPEGTMISVPTGIDIIPYTEQALKSKFPYYLFILEEIK